MTTVIRLGRSRSVRLVPAWAASDGAVGVAGKGSRKRACGAAAQADVEASPERLPITTRQPAANNNRKVVPFSVA